ncbi:MAG: hypothetical protein Q7S21_01805 [archaeon]|nr:hypothetical protein [archaeon]
MKSIENIKIVLSKKNYFLLFIISFIAFTLILSFFFELYKLPLHDFELLKQIVVWEIFLQNIFFILLASFLNALISTISIFRLKNIAKNSAKTSSSIASISISSILAACPLCAISVSTLLGASIVAAYIAPFYTEIRIASIVFSLLVLYYIARNLHEECEACRVKL